MSSPLTIEGLDPWIIIIRLERNTHGVINVKFPLQPHQKYYITQSKEFGFSSLTQMKDDYTTNSHYLTYTFLFRKVERTYSFNLWVKGLDKKNYIDLEEFFHKTSPASRCWICSRQKTHITCSRKSNNPIKMHILDGEKKERKTACILRLLAPGGMSKNIYITLSPITITRMTYTYYDTYYVDIKRLRKIYFRIDIPLCYLSYGEIIIDWIAYKKYKK